jgi:hypothetical protein
MAFYWPELHMVKHLDAAANSGYSFDAYSESSEWVSDE